VLAGAGYIPQAVIGAVLIVSAHLALRPVARRIDRLPASEESEVETIYRFRAVCRADELHRYGRDDVALAAAEEE
jgi:uncharacterized membrane protein YhiD involved in acid resistance